jgi:hypothetical protein
MKIRTKTITGVVLTFLITGSFVACDFLDQPPTSDLTNENYLSGEISENGEIGTATQLEQFLTGTYFYFGEEFWQLDWYILNDIQADNGYAGEVNEECAQIAELRILPTNTRLPDKIWGTLYAHIGELNFLIEGAEKVDDPSLTDARRKEIIGEARAMRALNYFNLVRIFGNAPLMLKAIPEINLENIDELYPLLYPPNATVSEIYTTIIEDLEYALANAPGYAASKFKMTKAVVNFLLAQVYATKDGPNHNNWQEVKDYLLPVVNDGRYGLMSNYDDLFAVAQLPTTTGILPEADLNNENCKESLFEVNYTGGGTGIGNWSATMFYGLDWKKYCTPSHDLFDAFIAAGDNTRREASITFGNVTGKWTDMYWPMNNYPFCWKQRARTRANIVLFRYAEAVLLLAEAENELGNLLEAQTRLNSIRNRVNLGNTPATTKETLRLAIENEYRLEFAFEGKRWMDLKRRGRFIEVMQHTTDYQKDYAVNLNNNKLLFPIPQSELDLNPNLVQNSGY